MAAKLQPKPITAFVANEPRTHPEWRLHQRRWKWLGDSLDGGEAYRQAVYGLDLRGQPIRNLIRHKHEYPEARDTNLYGQFGRPDGTDMAAQATDDDYEMRRARTPIPTVFSCVIHRHLSKIYSQTPKRNGPVDLLEWFGDVDGAGTTMAEWMRDTCAPLLEAYGQLDLICENPPAEPGDRDGIETKADLSELGLDAVVVGYILPENMIWWQLDRRGRYLRNLVEEPSEDGTRNFRFWEPDKWTLYDGRGEVIDSQPHNFKRPPIVRVFDRRRIRCKNVGLPRYEFIAEVQRNIYNTASELILSDTTQAHPLLQGPEDWCTNSTSIPMGIGRLVPKKRNTTDKGVTYEGFEVIDFPKGAADSLRTNITDMRDQVNEAALLTKPAGGAGTTGQTVAQSGVSKRMDSEDGNTYLGEIAGVLEKAERQIAELYHLVKTDGKTDQAWIDQIDICYPKDFDLFGPDELAGLMTDWQTLRTGVGGMPTIDAAQLKRLLRLIMLGAPPEAFVAYDLEIDAYVAVAAAALSQQAERYQVDLKNPEVPVGENAPALTAGSDNSYGASLAATSVASEGPYADY